MRWRYNNQRMLLYRPMLLSYAMRRIPFIALRAEERNAIRKCREIAELSIRDISMTSQMNQVLGWNAVWFNFQAAMIPLIGLYLRDPIIDDPHGSRESCRAQIETTKMTLYRMQTFGHTARRSLEVILRIAESGEQNLDFIPSNAGLGGPSDRFEQYGLDSQTQRTKTGGSLDSQFLPVDEPRDDSVWDYLGWGHDDIWSQVIGVENQEGPWIS